jgi:protein TonB
MSVSPAALVITVAGHALVAGAMAWSLGGGEPVVHVPSGPDPLTLPLGAVYHLPAPEPQAVAQEPREPVAEPVAEAAIAFPLPDLRHLLVSFEAEPEPPPARPVAEPVKPADQPAPAAPVAAAEPPPAQPAPVCAAAPSAPGIADGVPTVQRVPPEYPERARRSGQEGTVCLEVRLDQAGTPLAVAVARSSGHRLLDLAALAAVRRWRFAAGHAGATLVRVAFALH